MTAGKPTPGHYCGIADFVHKNSLEDVFNRAVRTHQSVENYADYNMETQSLVLSVLWRMNALMAKENTPWAYGVEFDTPVSPGFSLSVF